MDPSGSIILRLLTLFALILINAFFASGEIAIISLNDSKLKRQAEAGDKKARILCNLTNEPSKFLATIQVGVTLAGLFASAFAADSFSEPFASLFAFTGLSVGFRNTISLFIITIILSVFTLVFGELVPKRIAMRYYDKVSYFAAVPLGFIYTFLRPFVWFLAMSTNGFLRLFGIKPGDEPEEITEEEIRLLVDVGNEKGFIEESQKDMINNIFEFDDLDASDVMTHRTELTAVKKDSPISEIIKLSIEEGYSRIPVFEDDLDNIIGVIYVKDLLILVGKESPKDDPISKYMRPILFVPETGRCGDLLKEFIAKKIHIAVVIDEYGGTAGLVTMEDLLEAIVGNIQDEYDNEEEEISRLDDKTFTIDGSTDLDEISDQLEIEIDSDGDFDTLGGLIINELGRIPGIDEKPTIILDNISFTVIEMDDKRISKVRVEKLDKIVQKEKNKD